VSGPQDLVPTRTWSSRVSPAQVRPQCRRRDRAGKVPGEVSAVLSAYPPEARGRSRTRSFPSVIAELGPLHLGCRRAPTVSSSSSTDTMRSECRSCSPELVQGSSAGWPPHRGQTRPQLVTDFVQRVPSNAGPCCHARPEVNRVGDQASGRGPACHPINLDLRERSKMDPAFWASRDL